MAKSNPAEAEASVVEREVCGIIMPIAAMPGYDANHWQEVMSIIGRGIEEAGLRPEPVWGGGAADIIQERIVRNLYDHPIVVCDISGLNPNVMFELGLRLAFGKPTIVVTDGVQKAPFDINVIGYVPYPADLHILRTETFISELAAKIAMTMDQAEKKTYRPYIKTFGPIEPGSPGTDAIPLEKAVLDQLEQLSAAVRRLEAGSSGAVKPSNVQAFNVRGLGSAWRSSESMDEALVVNFLLIKKPNAELLRAVRRLEYVENVQSTADNLRVTLIGPRDNTRNVMREISEMVDSVGFIDG